MKIKTGLLVLVCMLGLHMSAVASDAPLTLEVVWKTDPSVHPINLGCSIAVDGLGNMYSTDYGADGKTYQIAQFDADGQFVKVWGETGSGPGEFNWRPDNPDNGPDAGFIAADEAGNVYVADGYNFRVQKFDNNGELLLDWGSMGEGEGQFVPPSAGPISVDPEGNVYVSDFAHVQKFDGDGNFLSAFGSAGAGEGEFTGAAQVAWDSQGNLYVADLLNARYQKFDAEGNFLLQRGTSGEGEGEFYWPLYVAVDSQDRVFVTDNTNRLQAFDTEGNFIATWTEPGNGDEPFEITASVLIDGEDNVYISYYREKDGCTIYKFRQT